jgi:hypothetical protein
MLRADHHIVASFDELSRWETNGVFLDDLLDGGLGYPPLLRNSGQPPSRYHPVRRPRS